MKFAIAASLLAFTAAEQLFLQETATPTAAPTAAPAEKRIVGYYTSWSIYARKFMPAQIPSNKVNVINYAFANIDKGEVVQGDSYADTQKAYTGDCWTAGCKRGNFNQLNKMKGNVAGLKTMIAIGGWSWSKYFSDVAATDATREKFATSAVKFAVDWGFDGLDINWEYPVSGGLAGNDHSPADKENFTALLKLMREKLTAQGKIDGKTYLISIATSANINLLPNYDFKGMMEYVDWVNMMSYDFHTPSAGSTDPITGFNAALKMDPKDKEPNLIEKQDFNVAAAVEEYIKAGIPKSKINAGLATYGRGFGGVTATADNNGLFAPYTEVPAIGTWEHGVFDYWDLKQNYVNKNDYKSYVDDVAGVPWLYNEKEKIMISYDDETSIAKKSQYIVDQDLGGAMMWEFSGDKNDDLIDSVRATFDKKKVEATQ